MIPRNPVAYVVATATCLITMLTQATPGIAALAVPGSPDLADDHPVSVSLDAADHRSEGLSAAAERYWTPERTAKAIPADGPGPVRLPGIEAGHAVRASGRAAVLATPRAPRSGVWPADADAARLMAAGVSSVGSASVGLPAVSTSTTVGRVFFHDQTDGLDYVCSGSAINNFRRNLVATAGHCVHGGSRGTWHTQWVFIPNYSHGARPYGTWSARQMTTFTGWASNSDFDWDLGLVNVRPNGGDRLVDRVGGHGLIVNYPRNVTVTLVAYPAAKPFDGQSQQFCQGELYPWGSRQVGLDCLLTGGASGGPFLSRYDQALGRGYLVSVISNGPDTSNFGPYFDGSVVRLYEMVANVG